MKMKTIFVVVLVCLLVADIQSQKCDEKCPDNCEFGTMHEKVGNCKRCVCNESPCKTKKCPVGTTCKPRKDPKCKEECKYKTQAHCVAEIKDGLCPAAPKVTPLIEKLNRCSTDHDCINTMKCCHQTCTVPCQTTKCTCHGKTVVQYNLNGRGCTTCSCVKEASQNPCDLPKVVGPCKATIKKFYYDTESKICKEFKYGGCSGNSNNFDTKEACVKKCEAGSNDAKSALKVEETVCMQPKVVGPCKAAFPKFFYNSTSKACEKFIYGGCEGNQNNFDTQEACEKKCNPVVKNVAIEICTMPKETGLCKGSFKRFHYDSLTNSCEEFIYGGCDGNLNNFETKDLCMSTCGKRNDNKKDEQHKIVETQDKCSLPMVIGDCKARLSRFYFDAASKSCKEFFYGGCGGNDNRFDSAEQCTKECLNHADKKQKDDKHKIEKSDSEDICKLPQDSGMCKAAFRKFSYNSTTNTCDMFLYGGCQGNENRFDTIEDCMKRCGKKDENIVKVEKKEDPKVSPCEQPKEVGPCRAAMPRFFYDSKTNSCHNFIYGGCKGNDNNFSALESCEKACVKKP